MWQLFNDRLYYLFPTIIRKKPLKSMDLEAFLKTFDALFKSLVSFEYLPMKHLWSLAS